MPLVTEDYALNGVCHTAALAIKGGFRLRPRETPVPERDAA